LLLELHNFWVNQFILRKKVLLRLNGLTEKFILKKIARGQMPAALVDRPKQSYRAPISRCFVNDQSPEYVADLLSSDALQASGYFDALKVQRLLDKCRQQEGRLTSERENMALVAILSTQLLDHQFIRDFSDFSKGTMAHAVDVRQED
jgi:asparagine synthase (glutamine-hydrolysing)